MTPKNVSRRKEKPISKVTDDRGSHLADVSIKNFRCFKDFSIGSLARVNLIGGRNNVGKTTLLEAIFLLLGATNISLIVRINTFRGMEIVEGNAASIREILWSHLFHGFDDREVITIQAKLGIGKRVALELRQPFGTPTTLTFNGSSQAKLSIDSMNTITEAIMLKYTDVDGKDYPVELQIDAKGINLPSPIVEPVFPGIFLSARRRPSSQENTSRYGQLEIADSHYSLLPALKIVEPRLKRLSTIVVGNTPMLYGDIGLARMVPLSAMGDGFGGLASLLLAISSASGGIVLIDEIENGLHYSIMGKVWQAIGEVSRLYNTQVFATTHSLECIKAAHDVFQAANLYDFCYHRIEQVDGGIEAVNLSQDVLQTTIESDWEIR